MNAHVDIEKLKAELEAYGNARYSWWFARKNSNFSYDSINLDKIHQQIKAQDATWDKQPWYRYWYFRLSSPYQHRLLQKQRALLCYSCATFYLAETNNSQLTNQTTLATIIHYHAPKLSFFSRIRATIMQFNQSVNANFNPHNNVKSNQMNNRSNTQQQRQNQNTFSITQALSCTENPERYIMSTQQRIIKRKVWDANAQNKLQGHRGMFVTVCDVLLNKMNTVDTISDANEAKLFIEEIKNTLNENCVWYVDYYRHDNWNLTGFLDQDDLNSWEGMTTKTFSNILDKTIRAIDSKYNEWLARHNTSPSIDTMATDESYKHELPPSEPTSNTTTSESSDSEDEFESNSFSAENATHRAESNDSVLSVEKDEKEDWLSSSFYQKGLEDLRSFQNKTADWQLRLFNDFRNQEKSVENEMKAEYRKLCLKYHPDKNPNHREDAETIFKALQNSWDELKATLATPEVLVTKVNGGFTKPEQAELWKEMQAFSRRMDEDNKKMREDLDRLAKGFAETGREQQKLVKEVEELKHKDHQLGKEIEELQCGYRKLAEIHKKQDSQFEIVKTELQEEWRERDRLIVRQQQINCTSEEVQQQTKFIENWISRLEQESSSKKNSQSNKIIALDPKKDSDSNHHTCTASPIRVK